MKGDTTRMRSEFENELARIRHNFRGIRDTNINVSFKGLSCIYKKNILSFYFEIDMEQNFTFY